MGTHPNRLRVVVTAVLLIVLGVELWAYRGVSSSLRELRANGLTALRDTLVEALERWTAEGRHQVERLAADSDLAADIRGVAAGGSRDGSEDRIVETALRSGRDVGMTTVVVLDAEGEVLVSSGPLGSGDRARAALLPHLPRLLTERSAFLSPGPDGEGAGRPGLVWVAASVRAGDGRAFAVMALGTSAAERFSSIFRVARFGRTGESLAFDAFGQLLSESRHSAVLAARGLVPRLFDPSTDAPTALASKAIAARSTRDSPLEGLQLQPYRNYLGREAVGTWRWLPAYDIGVAVEMEALEAYAPLTYLQVGFVLVLTLLAAVWLSGLVSPKALATLLRPGAHLPRLGPYRLLRQIGEGAISDIYLAQHRLLKRAVAVKVLKPHKTSEEWASRFRREVQLCSQLSHPNTITIHDYGTGPNGELYYAMEYLEGLALSDLVERYGPVPPSRTSHILRQVCASLEEAHARGLVHRDIKPQNIMLCLLRGEGDVVKVLDFGLVKQLDGEQTRDLTGTMRMLGTPLYMSPERIRNPSDADGRADIYAVGAVAFFLVTGRRIFESETDHDLTYQVLHTVPPLASEHSRFAVPPEFDDLIRRCLEKDPRARPQTVVEVARALDALLARVPWTRTQIEAWWKRHWVPPGHPERRFSVNT